MVFEPKKNKVKTLEFQTNSRFSEKASPGNGSLEGLVDQIADAVRSKLISRGVPLSETSHPGQPSTTPASFSQADRVGHTGDTPFQPHVLQEDQSLAKRIDHTLLKPDATDEEIRRICEEARKYKFATVCVNSSKVKLTADLLKGSGVKAIAVVGFPLGAALTSSKAFEAKQAISDGAEEIDMVINIGALKSRDFSIVLNDIQAVVEASAPYAVKVILETSNLTEEEKIAGCVLSKAAGAAFVKTSTGFGAGGATAEDVELMRRVVGPEMGVKASGGIRSFEDAEKMLQAGASRIGASASVAIVNHSQPKPSGSSSKKPKRGLY